MYLRALKSWHNNLLLSGVVPWPCPDLPRFWQKLKQNHLLNVLDYSVLTCPLRFWSLPRWLSLLHPKLMLQGRQNRGTRGNIATTQPFLGLLPFPSGLTAWLLPVCLIDKVMQPITFSLLFHQRVEIRKAMSLDLFCGFTKKVFSFI